MGVIMDDYNVTSKDGFFNGDIEKGEGNFGKSTKMMEGQCENKCNGDIESAISLVCSSGDEDLKSVKVVSEVGNNGDVAKKAVKEKAKSMSAKKPPKPPRAPRGLSLDSSDQKLIRELHEIARLKRARVERMKALKKLKETRVSSSSKSQLFASLLTTLFCLVLLLQGISSRTSTSIQGPPFSSEVAEQHSTISLRHYPFSSTANLSGFRSDPARLVEKVAAVDTKEQVNTAIE